MEEQVKKPLLILAGPTAAGKTKLSLRLAKAIGGEIISADSMQVYKYMDIGTAKIKPEEREGIEHYLIDVLPPSEECSVARFQRLAREAVETIYAKGKLPILTGGTGFYIQSVLYDVEFTAEEPDAAFRNQMECILAENGAAYLYRMLEEIDPVSAETIHRNNTKRIIRALEYYHHNQKRISEHNLEQRNRSSPYQYVYFVLTRDRNSLYQSINQRVEEMLERGFLKEVQKLRQMGYRKELVSMQGIGYRELMEYFDGAMDYEEAVQRIKKETRHFAKRQLTWFRREKEVVWLEQSQFQNEDAVFEEMMQRLHEKKII